VTGWFSSMISFTSKPSPPNQAATDFAPDMAARKTGRFLVLLTPMTTADYEFDRPTMEARWAQGLADAQETIMAASSERYPRGNAFVAEATASEKRQGTKSREAGHRRCRGCYGDFAAVRDLSAG
jgi:Patatin phospholipase